jgi:fructosamine-3-kinase
MNNKFKGNKLINSRNMTQQQQQQSKIDQEFFFTDYAVKTAFELMKFKGATVANEDEFLKVVNKIRDAVTPKESLIKRL